jgi:hypothetical protein
MLSAMNLLRLIMTDEAPQNEVFMIEESSSVRSDREDNVREESFPCPVFKRINASEPE